MYDFKQLNEQADLIQLYERITGETLRRQGNQYSGYCPLCNNGTDRFYVYASDIPQHWYCRQCHPYQKGSHANTAIDFVKEYYNLSLREAAEKLAALLNVTEQNFVHSTNNQARPRPEIMMQTEPEPPEYTWREIVEPVVQRAHENLLFRDAAALSYLTEKRKLTLETIRKYRIGYNPNRMNYEDIFFPPGYYFPNYIDGNLYRVKVRLQPRKPNEPKYKFVSGSKALSLYCAKYTDADRVIYVEGEMDAITINQEAGDICKAVTFGAHGYIGAAETWQKYYRQPDHTVICFDNDPDPETAKQVREHEKKLQHEITKAQSLDDAAIRGEPPVICHLNEKHHDWNDILQLENGSQIIRKILLGFFGDTAE